MTLDAPVPPISFTNPAMRRPVEMRGSAAPSSAPLPSRIICSARARTSAGTCSGLNPAT
jgi:hypothetical protein